MATDDIDSGLDELISIILPEIDAELINNPEARELLNDDGLPPNTDLNTIDYEYKQNNENMNISNILDNNNAIEWLSNLPSLPINPIDNQLMFANPFDINSNNKKSIVEQLLNEIENELNEIDEDNNGFIDFSEFSEIMESIDNTIIHSEIDEIWNQFIKNNNEIDELNIKIFIDYLNDQCNNNKILIESKKTVIRISFPFIFDKDLISSIDKLRLVLEEEGECSKSLDLPEFKSAMNNIGIVSTKYFHIEKIFQHFIDSQNISTSKYLYKKRELNIAFFIKYITSKVEDYDSFKNGILHPKEIVSIAFEQLLKNDIKKSRKGSHQLILNDYNNDANNHNPINPYIDNQLMGGIHKDFTPDKIKKFEKIHSISNVNQKNHRKLLREESGLKWKTVELDIAEQEMQQQLAEMMNASHTNNHSNI